MNKSIIPKLVNLLLIIVFISPLLYGLYLYDWDINRFIGFRGTEVKIDLSYKVNQVYGENSNIIFSLEIRNVGDVPVNLTRLEAALNATIDRQIHFTAKSDYIFNGGYNLQPGDSVAVELKFPVRATAGVKPYLNEIDYRLEINVFADIFGNTVAFPSVLEGGGPL